MTPREKTPASLRTVTLKFKPSPFDVELFKAHVRRTGCPETYTSISTSEPPSLIDAEILCEFQINKKKRTERDAAPCPICRPTAPKFLSGYLVWFPNEMCIRAVGKECGRKYYHKWGQAISAHKHREREARIEVFLEEELQLVPALSAELNSIHSVLENQRRIWAELRRKSPEVVEVLRAAMRFGYLTVHRKTRDYKEIHSSRSIKVPKYHEVNIGSVRGQQVVQAKFSQHSKVKQALDRLEMLNCGDDLNSAFYAICEMGFNEKVEAEKAIRSARTVLDRSRNQVAGFNSFFKPKNIALINQWSHDPSSQMEFRLELKVEAKSLVVDSPDYGWETVNLDGLHFEALRY